MLPRRRAILDKLDNANSQIVRIALRRSPQSDETIESYWYPSRNSLDLQKVEPALDVQAPSWICKISGGTPSRAGMMLVPSPPETIRCRSSSTTWP